MKDRVSVRQLRTQLSRHLREVEAGRPLTVVRHGRPVARLVPYQGITLIPGKGRLPELDALPRLGPGKYDVLGEMIASRRKK